MLSAAIATPDQVAQQATSLVTRLPHQKLWRPLVARAFDRITSVPTGTYSPLASVSPGDPHSCLLLRCQTGWAHFGVGLVERWG